MKPVLISACLMGLKCRYDGKSADFPSSDRLREHFNLIPFCPEVASGLSIPRQPMELKDEGVIDAKGNDYTEYFQRGAQMILTLAQEKHCSVAILKEYSPSCGVNRIYDGTHSAIKINGSGLAARMLQENGIKVYSDLEIERFLKEQLDSY